MWKLKGMRNLSSEEVSSRSALFSFTEKICQRHEWKYLMVWQLKLIGWKIFNEGLLISLIKVIIISNKNKLKKLSYHAREFSMPISISVPSSIKSLNQEIKKVELAGGWLSNVVHKKYKLMTKTSSRENRKARMARGKNSCLQWKWFNLISFRLSKNIASEDRTRDRTEG